MISGSTRKPNNFAQLVAALRTDGGDNAEERTRVIFRVAKWLDLRLEDVPCHPPALRTMMRGLRAPLLGVSAKTVANANSILRRTIVSFGEYQQAEPQTPTAAWAQWRARLRNHGQKILLTNLPQFFSWVGKEPDEIDDNLFRQYLEFRSQTTLSCNFDRTIGRIRHAWNHVVEDNPDLGLSRLQTQSQKKAAAVYLEDLSPSFARQVAAFLDWCAGSDIFADNARQKPLAEPSIKQQRRFLKLSVVALLNSGFSVASIDTLHVLVEVENFRTILRYEMAKSPEPRAIVYHLAYAIIRMARDYLRIEESSVAKLRELAGRIPRPSRHMSPRTRKKVFEVSQTSVHARIFHTPTVLWADVQKSYPRSRQTVCKAHAAIGVGILNHIPLRIKNLASLEFDRHIFIRNDGRSSLFIAAQENKSGAEMDFDLPPIIAEMLKEYREVVCPRAMGFTPQYVFSTSDNGYRSEKDLTKVLTNYLEKYVGIRMNPHVFRPLAGEVFLEAGGSPASLQHILGHKSITTTMNYYTMVNTRRGQRHYYELLSKKLG